MHTTTVLYAVFGLLTPTASAASTRDISKVRYFQIESALSCEKYKNYSTFSCDTSSGSIKLHEICGDGTFCVYGACGKWLGQEKMCCGGKGSDGRIDGEDFQPNSYRDACKRYKSVLENYNVEKDEGEKPLEEGCQGGNWMKNYPVNITLGESEAVWNRRKPPKYCCSVDHDSIMLFDKLPGEAKQGLCVPPLEDKVKDKDNSTAMEGGKNFGNKLAPGVIAVGLTVVAAIGLLY